MKAIVNALTLALIDEYGGTLEDARSFSARFVEENGDLFAPTNAKQAPVAGFQHAGQPVTGAPETFQVRGESDEVAAKFLQRAVGADGLTDSQRAGVTRGIPLCPNCQQPTNDHLPGCARIPELGTDPRAVTKAPLPPSS